MVGSSLRDIEIDFVVKDSLAALKCYERIFDVERIEVTDLKTGENEVVFSIHGTKFHLLDENPAFHLKAPESGRPISMWINVTVPDIKGTYKKAIEAGCVEVQPVVELAGYSVSNASFMDPYGYHWMLHQVHEVVSREERLKLWEDSAN